MEAPIESQHEVLDLVDNSAEVIESSIASTSTAEEPPVENVISTESTQTALEAPAQIDRTGPEPEVDNHIASSVEEVEGVLSEWSALGASAQSAVEEAPALAQPQTTDVGVPTAPIHEDPAAEPTQEVGSTEPNSVEGTMHPIPMDTAQGLVPLASSEVHDLASINNDPIGSGIVSSNAIEIHDVLPAAAEEIPIIVEPPTPYISTTTTEEEESSMEAAPAVDGVLTEIGIAYKQGLNETETESEVSEPREGVTDVVEDTLNEDSIITGTITEEEHATEEENIQLQVGQATGDDLAVNDTTAPVEEAALIEESQDEGERRGINVTAETTLVEAEAEKPEPAPASVVLESGSLDLVKVVQEDNSSLAAKEAPEISSGTMINPLTVWPDSDASTGDDPSLDSLQSSEGREDAIVTEVRYTYLV